MSNENPSLPETTLNLSLQIEGALAILVLRGRLDASTAGRFDADCATALTSGVTHCIVDMGGLEFISSAGLHSLLMLARQLDARRGTVCCCGLRANVRDVFSIAGLIKIFQIFDNLEDARAFIAGSEEAEA